MGQALSILWTQFFPPAATLTEDNLERQDGKVFVVTGGNSGVGFQLCKILYGAGGTVYMASRSEKLAWEAIGKIESSPRAGAKGQIHYLHLELSDLNAVRDAANDFKQREKKLDVLWNNAGISTAPYGSVSAQGHELTTATNCLGPFLFTQMLLPELKSAANERSDNSVRLIWTSSVLVDMMSYKYGLDISTIDLPPTTYGVRNMQYCATKVGNYFLASEFAKRYTPSTKIISLTQNPGNLKTRVWRNVDWLTYAASYLPLYDAIHGAKTMLWAGLSNEVKRGDSGRYVIPWGRWHPGVRVDVEEGLRGKSEGGNRRAEEFWTWCEEKTKDFI